MPRPALSAVQDDAPKPFTTGPSRATMVVTTGLLGLLNRSALESVLVHDLWFRSRLPDGESPERCTGRTVRVHWLFDTHRLFEERITRARAL
jgi:hypothetical protein